MMAAVLCSPRKAQAQQWEQVQPGDLVTDEGQTVQELVFVMEGNLQGLTLFQWASVST